MLITKQAVALITSFYDSFFLPKSFSSQLSTGPDTLPFLTSSDFPHASYPISGGPVHPRTLPPHALFKTLHHCSHPCLSSLSVLPTHGLHVIQSLAGPAASSLPQPRQESQQRDGLLALQDRPQEDNRLGPGGSCWLTRIMWLFLNINQKSSSCLGLVSSLPCWRCPRLVPYNLSQFPCASGLVYRNF